MNAKQYLSSLITPHIGPTHFKWLLIHLLIDAINDDATLSEEQSRIVSDGISEVTALLESQYGFVAGKGPKQYSMIRDVLPLATYINSCRG